MKHPLEEATDLAYEKHLKHAKDEVSLKELYKYYREAKNV